MTAITDLRTRTLEKVGVQADWETPSANDMGKALQALKSAHNELAIEDLLLWTMNDIPEALEEAYVMMAAWYAGPEFGFPVDITIHELGLRMVRKYAMTRKPITPVEAEYF